MNFVQRPPSFKRSLSPALRGDPELGPFVDLPGKWVGLAGAGHNLMALPFAGSPQGYRLLASQYDEILTFEDSDKNIANRGVSFDGSGLPLDQYLVALNYVQTITQTNAEDSPPSGLSGHRDVIHHELDR